MNQTYPTKSDIVRFLVFAILLALGSMLTGCSTTQQAATLKDLTAAQTYVTKAQADLALVQTTLPAITGTADATKANNYLSYIDTALQGLQIAIPAAQAIVSTTGTTP